MIMLLTVIPTYMQQDFCRFPWEDCSNAWTGEIGNIPERSLYG